MKFNARLFNILAAATALAFFMDVQAGNAATISTSDSSVFAADTTGAIVGNFNSVPTTVPGASPGTFFSGYNPLSGYTGLQGVSFSTSNSGGVVNVNSAGFYGASDLQAPYAVNSSYTVTSAPDVLTITLPHPETAFALDFNSLFSSTLATFVLSNGYTTSVTTPSSFGKTDFIGFVSSTPFDSITLSVPGDQSWVVADFTQADATATPLPPSWIMMIMAMLALAGVMYRRTGVSKVHKNTAS